LSRAKRLLPGILAAVIGLGAELRAADPGAVRAPPFFWHESDPEAGTSFSMALLLYWSGAERDSRFRIVAPLYYDASEPGEAVRVLFPLHFQRKSAEAESGLWGPYFSRTSLRARTSLLFPVYFRRETGADSARVLFPLYWKFASRSPDPRSLEVFLPFYVRVADGKTRSLYSWLGGSFRDEKVSQGLIVPYFWRKAGDSATEVGFPLYWRFKRQRAAGPLDVQVAVPWFRVRTASSSLRSFFPVYWGRTDAARGARWDILFPLAFGAERPDGSRSLITPLYSRFRDPDGRTYGHAGLFTFSREPWGGKSESILPFVSYREEPDSFRFRFLTFIARRDRGGAHSDTILWPLARFKRDADRRQVLTPVAYWDRDPEMSRGFLFPYFWLRSRSTGERKSVAFPVYWNFQDGEGRTTVVPPLLAFHSRPGYDLALAAPFYFRRRKGDDTFTLIPPFLSRENPRGRWWSVLGLYWNSGREGRTSVALLPLFRKSRFPDGSSLFLPGFYYLREGKETQGWAGPYLWDHRGETRYEIFPPLLWRFRRPAWEIRSIFPAYSFRSARIREKGFFPLWARTEPVDPSTGPGKHFLADSSRFLPFYFYRKLDPGYDLWVPPLLGRFESGKDARGLPFKRRRTLLVSYWERTPTSVVNRLDPLFSYRRNPREMGFAAPTAPLPLWRYEVKGLDGADERVVLGSFFPYFWKETKTARKDFVLPLFYRSTERSEDAKTIASRKTWFLNAYASRKASGERVSVFFPVYWKFADARRTRVLLPPFWSEDGPGLKRRVAFPLWWRSVEDGRSRTAFFPLFYAEEDGSGGRKVLALPGIWRSARDGRSETAAGIYFSRRDEKSGESSDFVFPLFWRSVNRERSLAAFFPLFFRRHTDRLDLRIFFPLFWKFSTKESSVLVLPPYFRSESKSTGETVSGFAPLWTRSRNLEKDASGFQVLGGLFGIEREGQARRVTLLYIFKI